MADNYTQDTLYGPPAGYRYAANLFGDWDDELESGTNRVRLLLNYNLLALIPLAVGVLLLWLPYQFYVLLGNPLSPFPDWSPARAVGLVVGGLIILASMFIHELLHGVALRVMGYPPLFAYYRGYLAASVPPDVFLTRHAYLVMSLTPLLTMTLGGAGLLLVLPRVLGQPVLLAVLLNMAASIGDIAVAARVRRWPEGTLFADHERIRVYVPLPEGGMRS